MSTPLERPELPRIEARGRSGTVVSVFGPGADAMAQAMREARPEARGLRVELRHAHGWELRGEVLFTHPDTLSEALDASWPDARIVIGVGAAFAIAVQPTLGLWVTGGSHLIALPPPLRASARRAHLTIEHARPRLAARLARAL